MGRFGDGFSAGADVVAAADVAARAATEQLAGRRPDLAMVFACGTDPDDVAGALQHAAGVSGATTAIGCSASGVIGAGRAAEATTAVSVWCAVLPDVRLRAFHLEVMPAESGMAVVGLPPRTPDDSVCVVLADPWSFPVDGFVEQSTAALDGLPLVGGLASGLRGRGSTRLLVGGDVVDRGAVGVVLGGPVGARSLVSQGCRPVGPAMTVTAADGNVLLEVAGVPVLDKLREIVASLDPDAQALATTGLQIGIAMDEYADVHGRGDFLVRGIAGADDVRRGLVVGDLVPVGRTVQFQVRDAASADADLRHELRSLVGDGGLDTVESALLFSCNGRGAGLFGRADHDVTVVRDGLGVDHVAGFFAAGEIGPVGGRNHVHGVSAAVLAFGSGSAADRGTHRPAGRAADA